MLALVDTSLWGNNTYGKIGMSFYAATDLRSDASRLVFVSVNYKVFRFRIDDNGLAYDNYYFELPNVNIDQYGLRAEMEIANLPNGTYRLAVPYLKNGTTSSLLIASLDAQGNLTASHVFDFEKEGSETIPYIHGLEFSPSGGYLYLTHQTNSLHPNPLEFIDLQNLNNGVQPLNVPNAADYQFSQIERGTNGKLYFAGQSGTSNTADRLSTLSNSDSPTNNTTWINTNWVNSALSVSYQASYRGLPSTTPYESFKSYTLPDQIDGEDYFAHFTATQECCRQSQIYTIDSYTVSAYNSTWEPGNNPFTSLIGNDTIITVKSKLVVPALRSLTLKNMRIEFAPEAILIVEKGPSWGFPGIPSHGGKLFLDNSTLTIDRRCGNARWQGVEVRGWRTQPQNYLSASNKQGYLQMNNSKIEYAQIGVLAASRAPNGAINSFDTLQTGGIVRAFDSDFYQNTMDAYFLNYVTPGGISNQSRFNNCKFTIINNGDWNNINPQPFMRFRMRDVMGINLYGCDFSNDGLLSQYAIFSHNSRFGLMGLCTNLNTPCTMDWSSVSGFSMGVYATSPILNASRNNYISYTIFKSNQRGVYWLNQLNSSVVKSDFQIPTTSGNYGLYIDRSTKFKVTENYFHSNTDNAAIGVIANNTDTEHNEIYKNDFENLIFGVLAQKINGTIYANFNVSKGLKILCNRFLNNITKADIAVSSGRIDYQQGVFTQYPAHNQFSYTENGAYDIFNCDNCQGIDYKYNPNIANHEPIEYTMNTVNVDDFLNYNGPVCPSKVKFGPGMWGRQKSLTASYDSIVDHLNSGLLDSLQIAQLTMERNELLLDIIRHAQFEIEDSAAQAEFYSMGMERLDSLRDDLARWMQYDFAISSGKFQKADSILHSMGFSIPSANTDLATYAVGKPIHQTAGFLYSLIAKRLAERDTAFSLANIEGAVDYLADDSRDTLDIYYGLGLKMYFNDSIYFSDIEDINMERSIKQKSSNTKEEFLHLIPNPSRGVFQVITTLSYNSIEVCNLQGVKVITMFKNSDTAKQIDLSDLPAGIYVCSFINGQNTITKQKVVIVR